MFCLRNKKNIFKDVVFIHETDLDKCTWIFICWPGIALEHAIKNMPTLIMIADIFQADGISCN